MRYNRMKKIIIIAFLLPNLILAYVYVCDLILLSQNKFYNDGWRYFFPIIISDVLFFVSLLLMFIKTKYNIYILLFIGIILIHNFIVIMGEYFVPFIGLLLVITSFISVFRWYNRY